MKPWNIITGDSRKALASLPDGSAQCCVTSPPYWGLRDYGVDGQIGLETTPEEYVAEMVAVFREVRRVLRDDGTLWLNLGDSYANDAKWGGSSGGKHVADLHGQSGVGRGKRDTGLKPKDLVGIPWRVAFALQADGWYLRSDIIWAKPNPMPESVTDRPTKAHEYMFLLAKPERYYFDAVAIAEQASGRAPGNKGPHKYAAAYASGRGEHRTSQGLERIRDGSESRNARTVWTVASQPFAEAHFATFPEELARRCIVAGSSERGACSSCGAPWARVVTRVPAAVHAPRSGYGVGAGRNDGGRSMLVGATSETTGWQPSCECGAGVAPCVVIDPFNGAGTTGLVAVKNGRRYIGCELNAEYVDMAERRIEREFPALLWYAQAVSP